MIVDKITSLDKYFSSNDKVKLISNFIDKSKTESLQDGRYELNGENLFALIQNYETKNESDCTWESHEKYIDLQFIEKGKEIMRWTTTDYLDVKVPYNENNDLTFYKNSKSKSDILIEEDMFVVFYPTDAHKPCVKAYEKEKVKKIVFKIKNI